MPDFDSLPAWQAVAWPLLVVVSVRELPDGGRDARGARQGDDHQAAGRERLGPRQERQEREAAWWAHLRRSLAVVRLPVKALQLECALQQHRSLRVFASPEQRIEEILGCYQLAFRDLVFRDKLVCEHHATPIERMVLAPACWIVHPLRAETLGFMNRCGSLLEKLADERTLGGLAILDAAAGKPTAGVAWTAADEQHLAVRREG